MTFFRRLLPLACLLGSLPLAHADWIWTRQGFPNVGALTTAATGNGVFVAASNTGYVLSSRDGVNWTTVRPAIRGINDVTFGGDRFVAVVERSQNGGSQLLYSRDGVTWNVGKVLLSPRTFRSDHNLQTVASARGGYLALGDNQRAVATSSSGRRWRDPLGGRRARGYVGSAAEVAAQSGTYFMTSRLGGVTIQRSRDGVDWTTEFRISPRGPARGLAAEIGGRRLVCVGENGLNVISSNGGNTWRSRPFGSTDFLGVTWGGRQFLAFTSQRVFSSPTGFSWTQQLRTTRNGDRLRATAAGSGRFLAVGSNGARNGVIYVSTGVPAPSSTPTLAP